MAIALRPHLLRSVGALALAAPVITGCGTERPPSMHPSGGGGDGGVSVTAIYALPASLEELAQETWFDHPWPSDLRLENGSPRFAGFYNPRGFAILDTKEGCRERERGCRERGEVTG